MKRKSESGYSCADSRHCVESGDTRRSTRRTLLLALCVSTVMVPISALGQQQERTWRIGYLSGGSASSSVGHRDFVRGMRELGYVEGKEFILERRYAEGRYERFPELAAELVRLKVDVIVVAARAAAPAVQRATSTIPIVVTSSADPVGGKLAANLARPGGNITGLSSMTTETGPKQLELLKVMVPHLTRVAVLVNPNNSSGLAYLKAVREASHKLTLTVLSINASSPAELEHAFASMQQARADGLLVATDSLFLNQRQHIARLALGYRLPAIVGRKEYAEAGFLMSYGQSLGESTRRAASYVDKILKGAKPSELPMEQPMRFDLVINRKTADALGLAIPRELLLSADKVIE